MDSLDQASGLSQFFIYEPPNILEDDFETLVDLEIDSEWQNPTGRPLFGSTGFNLSSGIDTELDISLTPQYLYRRDELDITSPLLRDIGASPGQAALDAFGQNQHSPILTPASQIYQSSDVSIDKCTSSARRPLDLLCHDFQPPGADLSTPSNQQSSGIIDTEFLQHVPVQCPKLRPTSLLNSEDVSIKSKKRSRLTKNDCALLREFFDKNIYPEEGEKEILAAKIGATKKQVSNWFANARRPARSAKRTATPDQLDPLERWLHTPPQEEPVTLPVIVAAIDSTDKQLRDSDGGILPGISTFGPRAVSPLPTYNRILKRQNSDTSPQRYPRASIRRHESGSVSGVSSAASASSNVSKNSYGSRTGRQGKRIKVDVHRGLSESVKEKQYGHLFQCTWCYQGFSRKDAWKRHEEVEHCPGGEFVCMLNGPTHYSRDSSICVFCSRRDPTIEHFRGHRVDQCYSRPESKRCFTRPDSFQQHIRQMHPNSSNSVPLRKFYRLFPSAGRVWCCGFCEAEITDWNVRATHIANHFVAGLDMRSWMSEIKGFQFAASRPQFGDPGLSSTSLTEPVGQWSKGDTPDSVVKTPSVMSGVWKTIENLPSDASTARAQLWKERRQELFQHQTYFFEMQQRLTLEAQECSQDIAMLETKISQLNENYLLQNLQIAELQRQVCDLYEQRKYYRCEQTYFFGLCYKFGTTKLPDMPVVSLTHITSSSKRRASIG